MDIREWKETGNTFVHKGHSIFYQEGGEGETLLLLHGFPTASWDWAKMWPTLTASYHVVAPDMLGFGYSDKPKDMQYSILDQAIMHEALCAHKGIERVHVLAHDYGDTVAQELLARLLDRLDRKDGQKGEAGSPGLEIQSVCFLNGGLFPETHHPRLIQTLLLSPVGGLLAKLTSKRTLRKNFHAIFGPKTPPTEAEIDAFWDLMVHKGGKNIVHKLLRYMPERKQHRERWVGAIASAPCPVLLLNGPEDPVSGRHMARRYEELIPNPQVISLEGIGHYPQVEAPEQVLSHYLNFLKSL